MAVLIIPLGIFLGVMLGAYPVITLSVLGGLVFLFFLNGAIIEIGDRW